METTAIPPIYVVSYYIGIVGPFTQIFHDELSAWHYYTDIIDGYQCSAYLHQMKPELNGAFSYDKALAASENDN